MESKQKRVLTKKDITRLGYRSTYLQAMFNYERMQSGGWLLSMLPALEKIYKDNPESLVESINDNLSFINTSPPLVSFLMGIVLLLEEAGSPRETIS